MEALAMGLPTIAATGAADASSWMRTTSWLVGGALVDVPDDAELFNGLYRGHRWFEPDADDLAAKLREIAVGGPRPACALLRPAATDRPLRHRAPSARLAAAVAAADGHAGPLRGRHPGRLLSAGQFGSGASLAPVNDGLADGLERAGSARRAPLAVGPPVLWRRARDLPCLAAGLRSRHRTARRWMVHARGSTGAPVDWVREAAAKADRVWVYERVRPPRVVAGGMSPGMSRWCRNGIDPHRFSPAVLRPRAAPPLRAARSCSLAARSGAKASTC